MTNDRVSSLVFLAISVAFLIAAAQMPLGQLKTPGAGFMPLILSIFMVAFGGAFTCKAFLRPGNTANKPMEKGALRRVFFLLLGLVAYCVLLKPVGFPVLTLIFLVVFMKILGVPRWRTILVVALVATVCAILIFETWLAIPFPRGLWWPE
jgi:putative tricarboxylic transport membrane protein